MAAERRFLAIDGEHGQILDWFRVQPLAARENKTLVDQVVLWYESEGPLVYCPTEINLTANRSPRERKSAAIAEWNRQHGSGQPILDEENTPLVRITLPRRLRGVIWSAGSVTFTGTPLRTRFPRLAGLYRAFAGWLRHFDLVYDPDKRQSDLDYYLEGGIRNYDSEVRALPKAATALRNGQYFVNVDATDASVYDLCRQLRLRGVNCDPAGP